MHIIFLSEQSNSTIMEFRDYSFGHKILGQGFSSVVYKAKKYKSKQQFALKIIKEDFLKTDLEKKLLFNQIRIHSMLKHHKNIVNLIEHGNFANNYALVMQLCEKGSLAEVLQKTKILSQTQAIYIIKEVIKAYKVLYSMKILHRDIKPGNVLITQSNEIKLSDFGLSIKSEDSDKSQMVRIGTACFMAPEIAKQNIYTYKGDIWAIGITFFRMIVGEVPFKSHNHQNFLKQVKQTKIQDLIPQQISEGCRMFLINSLNINHQQRMPAEQLFNFQFQRKYELKMLSVHNSGGNELKKMINKSEKLQNIKKELNQDKRVNYITKNRTEIANINTKLNISYNISKQTLCTTASESNFIQQSNNNVQQTNPKQRINVKSEQSTLSKNKPSSYMFKKNYTQQTNIVQKQNIIAQKQIQKNQNKSTSTSIKQQIRQSKRSTIKQMQKVTRILMNQVDFLRFQIKIIHFIDKFFTNQFNQFQKGLKMNINQRLKQLKRLDFIKRQKLQTYKAHPLYRQWIELIEDYQHNLQNLYPPKSQQKNNIQMQNQHTPQQQTNLKQLIQKTVREIYIQFDKSIKTKSNTGKLITLDYLICLNDLLQMNNKGEENFYQNSLLNIILQAIQKLKIQPDTIDELFKGISKKLVDLNYF